MRTVGGALLAASVLWAVLVPPVVLMRVWLSGDQTDAAKYLNRVDRKVLKWSLITCAIAAPIGAAVLVLAPS